MDSVQTESQRATPVCTVGESANRMGAARWTSFPGAEREEADLLDDDAGDGRGHRPAGCRAGSRAEGDARGQGHARSREREGEREGKGREASRHEGRRRQAQARLVGRHLVGPGAARHRPGRHVRPHRRRGRRPDRQEALVPGRGLGRRLEDRERRHHLDARLRRRGVLLDRLRRDRPEEPERRLGRHRREQLAAQRRLRRRRLQERGRRQELEEHGAQDLRAHRQDPHRTRRTRTSSTSRRRARSGRPAASAASTRRPTAARPGRPS